MVSARTTRQKRVQSITAMAMMMECRPVPMTATRTIDSSTAGKAIQMSTSRGDGGIDPAAEIAGEQAERGAEQAGGSGGGDGDEERDLGAVDQSGQDIPAQIVGAEQVAGLGPVGPDRRDILQHQILLDRVVRCEQGREDGGEREEQQHRAAQRDPAVRQQPAQGAAVRPCLRCAGKWPPPQPWRIRGLSNA